MTTARDGTSRPIAFRPGPIVEALAARADDADRPEISRRDLGRYYAVLDDTLRELGLSEGEWNYFRSILNGTLLDERTYQYLWAEVADGDAGAALEHGVDQDELAQRVRNWPAAYRMAVVDAVERWWRQQR